MRSIQSRIWTLTIIGLVSALTVAVVRAESQTSASDSSSADLVKEVHGLRVATERLASTGLRVQIALGRLQLEEQRIGELQRRLDGIREGIRGDERGTHPELKTEAGQIEQEISAETAHWTDVDNELQRLEQSIDQQR